MDGWMDGWMVLALQSVIIVSLDRCQWGNLNIIKANLFKWKAFYSLHVKNNRRRH